MPINIFLNIYYLPRLDAETVKNRFFQAYKDYISLYWEMLEKARNYTDKRRDSKDS